MKRYKLKESVKEKLMLVGFIAMVIVLVIVGIDRFSAINSGEMKIVSQTEMAERK